MSLCVVGSIGLDTVETPFGKVEGALGGSAIFFSVAASRLTKVRLVGVAGTDLPDAHVRTLEALGVDLEGLERAEGKTFFWHGRYSQDMNERETIQVDLNVFGDFQPKVPESYRDSELVFLANGSPVTQAAVLDQMAGPRFTMMDTMDLWIETTRDELVSLIGRVDAIVLNDSEVRLLTERDNLVTAARAVLEMGPSFVVVKKGEHGAFMVSQDAFFTIPAYPCEVVRDPTGAGDSFAGGLMGYLDRVGRTDVDALRTDLAYGTVAASFTVEDFSIEGLRGLDADGIEARLSDLRGIVSF